MRASHLLFLLGLLGLMVYGGLQARAVNAGRVARSSWPNGQRQAEIALNEGERHGPASGWHENGELRFQGAYDRGQRQGEWLYFAPDGALDRRRSGSYIDGHLSEPLPSAGTARAD